MLGFSQYEGEDIEGFSLEWQPTREASYDKNIQTFIIIELSNNLLLFERRVYTTLDMLADIGGLSSSLSLVCLAIVIIFQFYGSQ